MVRPRRNSKSTKFKKKVKEEMMSGPSSDMSVEEPNQVSTKHMMMKQSFVWPVESQGKSSLTIDQTTKVKDVTGDLKCYETEDFKKGLGKEVRSDKKMDLSDNGKEKVLKIKKSEANKVKIHVLKKNPRQPEPEYKNGETYKIISGKSVKSVVILCNTKNGNNERFDQLEEKRKIKAEKKRQEKKNEVPDEVEMIEVDDHEERQLPNQLNVDYNVLLPVSTPESNKKEAVIKQIGKNTPLYPQEVNEELQEKGCAVHFNNSGLSSIQTFNDSKATSSITSSGDPFSNVDNDESSLRDTIDLWSSSMAKTNDQEFSEALEAFDDIKDEYNIDTNEMDDFSTMFPDFPMLIDDNTTYTKQGFEVEKQHSNGIEIDTGQTFDPNDFSWADSIKVRPPEMLKEAVDSGSKTLATNIPTLVEDVAMSKDVKCLPKLPTKGKKKAEEIIRRGPRKPTDNHLWMFLCTLLNDDTHNPSKIRWIDEDKGKFKIEDREQIARMWVDKKGKDPDQAKWANVARSLRTYYEKDILHMVTGMKDTYLFGKNSNWRDCLSSS